MQTLARLEARLPNITRVGLEKDGRLHTNLEDDQEATPPPIPSLPPASR